MLLVCSSNQMTPDPASTSLQPPRRFALADLTAQSLRAALRAGQWQGFLPGERELSARLQVSRSTLRAALEELQREGLLEVDARQRRRIRLRQEEAPAAHSRVIAVLSARPLLEMTTASVVMVDELREKLAQAGFRLVIHVQPSCFSAQPARALEALTERVPAAAWLLFGSLEPMQRWFVRRALPCLVVGSCVDGMDLPSVDADHRATCRHAGLLLRRKGHRQIALVRPEGDYGGDLDSECGLREAFTGTGAPALRVLRHNGSAAHLVARLDAVLKGPNAPTAFVVARAVHALTVVMHLQRLGKRLPQEVMVISRDDESFLQHAVPRITRYSTQPEVFARRVSQAVRRIAEGGALPRRALRLMPAWIPGETA
jgi:DNA-binding LacI/PurR family transcriptional regulator